MICSGNSTNEFRKIKSIEYLLPEFRSRISSHQRINLQSSQFPSNSHITHQNHPFNRKTETRLNNTKKLQESLFRCQIQWNSLLYWVFVPRTRNSRRWYFMWFFFFPKKSFFVFSFLCFDCEIASQIRFLPYSLRIHIFRIGTYLLHSLSFTPLNWI